MPAIALILCAANFAFGAEVSQSFVYQGRFFNAAGTAPLLETVDITFTIYSPDGQCLLYQEQHPSVDLSATNGLFSVKIGSPVPAPGIRTPVVDPGLSMPAVFSNTGIALRAPGSP